jgi:hypothetical protein
MGIRMEVKPAIYLALVISRLIFGLKLCRYARSDHLELESPGAPLRSVLEAVKIFE